MTAPADSLDAIITETAARMVAGPTPPRTNRDRAFSVAAYLSLAALGGLAGYIAFMAGAL